MVEYRKYKEDDYDFVYQLKKECYYPYVVELWGWDEADQLKRFEAFMEKAALQMVILCVDGVSAGMMNWCVDGDILEIENICLDSKYRNRGIGTLVLSDVINKCRFDTIALQAFKNNPVIGLYKRLGFEVVGESEFHYQMMRKGD